jgi:hypothetical protein
MNPLDRLLQRVSEMSKEDDDQLEEQTEQPADSTRKRRSKDLSYKLTSAFRRAKGGVRR